jgi:hypothetical protein
MGFARLLILGLPRLPPLAIFFPFPRLTMMLTQ